jgi:hypothetical protein
MVWASMGLLDDAIREHLELKRRRGADPEEVAREQHEALEPVASTVEANDAPGSDTAPSMDAVTGAPENQAIDPAVQVSQSGRTAPMTASTGVPEETAELDMSSVLGDDANHVSAAPHPAANEAADSLEWEMPAATASGKAEHEEPEEDVLEETPDFLSETPEQERLWFEQRPPRDFDFDK